MTALPKIVFFDIDDTLFIKRENRIPASVCETLLTLKQQGVIVAIATGRGRAIFPSCVNELIAKVGIDVLVTINGQYNQVQGREVACFPLSSAQIGGTVAYLKSQKVGYGLMTADQILAFDESPAMVSALMSLHIPYQVVDDFDNAVPVYQMLAFYEDNSQAVLPLGDDLRTVRWHVSGVDILDVHGSKARGIKAVLDSLGLPMDEAWAFGDGLNDIEMIQNVGFGVAMGNACDELKSVADFVAPNIDDDGIFRALRELNII